MRSAPCVCTTNCGDCQIEIFSCRVRREMFSAHCDKTTTQTSNNIKTARRKCKKVNQKKNETHWRLKWVKHIDYVLFQVQIYGFVFGSAANMQYLSILIVTYVTGWQDLYFSRSSFISLFYWWWWCCCFHCPRSFRCLLFPWIRIILFISELIFMLRNSK